MTKPEDWLRMPVAELTSAQKRGPLMVYRDRWWSLDKDGNAMFYKTFDSPQCNANEALVRRLMTVERGYDVGNIIFLPWAYVRFSIGDYA